MGTITGGVNVVIDDALVLYLDAANIISYNNVDTTWYDLSKEANNCLLINGPTFDQNNSGSIVFDGTNDYGQIENTSSLSPTQTITLSAWCMFNGTYTGYYAPIIFKRNNYLSFFEQYQLAYLISGNLQIAMGDGSTNQSATSPNTYINQLVNVVGVIDTINSILKLYVNGELVATQVITYPNMDVSTNPVIIGASAEPSFQGFIGGNIYSVSIYNKVLSEEEILQNYNTIKTRFGL